MTAAITGSTETDPVLSSAIFESLPGREKRVFEVVATGRGLPVLCVDVIVSVHWDVSLSLSRIEVIDGGTAAVLQD